MNRAPSSIDAGDSGWFTQRIAPRHGSLLDCRFKLDRRTTDVVTQVDREGLVLRAYLSFCV